jgi:hypothetical protein
MPDLKAIAFSVLVTSPAAPAIIVALAPLDIILPWVRVGVVPSVVKLIRHPAVALVTLTVIPLDGVVLPAGLNVGCATWVIDWVVSLAESDLRRKFFARSSHFALARPRARAFRSLCPLHR